MNIQINEFVPRDRLKPFVELFWEGDFNTNSDGTLRQRVVPNGYMELVMHLTDLHCDLFKNDNWSQSPHYTIIGLHTQTYEVRFGSYVRVFGIRFKPEGFYDIFGVPAAEFGDTFDDMGNVLGKKFQAYSERLKTSGDLAEMLLLTEQYLMAQLERRRFEENYIHRAAELIRQSKGFTRIEDLSKQVFVSARQLERSFKQHLGVSPKFYMRIARLNEAQRLLETRPSLSLTQLSYECGYADQAHFIHDFNDFIGIRPKHFVKKREDFIVNAHLAALAQPDTGF